MAFIAAVIAAIGLDMLFMIEQVGVLVHVAMACAARGVLVHRLAHVVALRAGILTQPLHVHVMRKERHFVRAEFASQQHDL